MAIHSSTLAWQIPWAEEPGRLQSMGSGSSVQFSSVAQSCPTLCDPMDCSLPGSSAHGICQARVLEWGAIAFSGSILVTYINMLSVKLDEIIY